MTISAMSGQEKKFASSSTQPLSQTAPRTLGAVGAKGSSIVNSLGMKFVPVPGTKILMCIHETRRLDYAKYAAEVPDVDASWSAQQKDGYPCGDKDDHPVVGVSWDQAKQFCGWLTKKESKTYRLPTDEEWSIAVGLGGLEKRRKDTTPEMLAFKEQTQFPWGGSYPPNIGNYADEAYQQKFPNEPSIKGYRDGFVTTSPVMSFKPNKLGIYDMGGNAWEWVEDQWSGTNTDRVFRGASFKHSDRNSLLSSFRYHLRPSHNGYLNGFRCVLEQ
jgi:formylglycine-generating enzyme required for sulfatase activity